MSDWLGTHSTDSANHGLDVRCSVFILNEIVLKTETDVYARPHTSWHFQVRSISPFHTTTSWLIRIHSYFGDTLALAVQRGHVPVSRINVCIKPFHTSFFPRLTNIPGHGGAHLSGVVLELYLRFVVLYSPSLIKVSIRTGLWLSSGQF